MGSGWRTRKAALLYPWRIRLDACCHARYGIDGSYAVDTNASMDALTAASIVLLTLTNMGRSVALLTA